MTDLPLFALARASDPAPSHRAAALAVSSGTVRGHAALILDCVRAHPGVNSHGIALETRLHITQVDRRASELERRGLVRRTDEGQRSLRWWPCEAKGGE